MQKKKCFTIPPIDAKILKKIKFMASLLNHAPPFLTTDTTTCTKSVHQEERDLEIDRERKTERAQTCKGENC
jgi:hypothetical protein